MLRSIAPLVLLALVACRAAAELPPSVYESMQTKASECLDIEVLRVEIEPGETADKQTVHVTALVSQVHRSANGLKNGDVINILYTVTDHPKGWVGPGEIPILSERDKTVAYLGKDDSGDYKPVAGTMSFRNF